MHGNAHGHCFFCMYGKLSIFCGTLKTHREGNLWTTASAPLLHQGICADKQLVMYSGDAYVMSIAEQIGFTRINCLRRAFTRAPRTSECIMRGAKCGGIVSK